MSIAPPDTFDAETEALLAANGIDPARVRARQAELAEVRLSLSEAAKLAAERAELRESTEALNALIEERGLLSDHILFMRRTALRGAPIDNLAHESFRIQTALDIVFSAAG